MIRDGVFLFDGYDVDDLHRVVFPELFPETALWREPAPAFPETMLMAVAWQMRIEAVLLETDIGEAIRLQAFDKLDRLHIIEHQIDLHGRRLPPAVASRWQR